MKNFATQLSDIRKSKNFKTLKSFYEYLCNRGLDCNYQYYVKLEKDQSFPSSIIVNQMAKALDAASAQVLIMSFCQNQFQSFSYLFSTSEVENEKVSQEKKINLDQGQKELSPFQISVLSEKKENYFLFLLLTLSRSHVHKEELKKYPKLSKSIKDLEKAGVLFIQGDLLTSSSSEFRFPISDDKKINMAYKDFDLWDLEFSSQFEFNKLVNKMMIRRISPRYLSAIQKQIDTISDFVRLSDEADKKHNNSVLHLQIQLSQGEIPG